MTDLFQTSGTSPTTDFICENAKMWIQEKLPLDHMTFADAVVIEPRYVWAILLGLQENGLVVTRG